MNKRALFILFAFVLLSILGSVSAMSVNNSYYRYEDVLLVCNNASVESNEICSYFLQQRSGLGLRNVLNLSGITTSEGADCNNGYISLQTQVANYIANRTNDTINYIVTTKGVPLTACGKSLNSLLACNLTSYCGRGSTYAGAGVEEQFSSVKHRYYITTRLDGYTVQDVKNLIDRSGPSNRNSSALSLGKFIIDESNYAGFSTYLSRTNTVMSGRGYNILYLPANTQPLYIRNESNVIGYVSWGGNDPDYAGDLTRFITNRDFDSWSGSTQPSSWVVSSGTIYRKNYTANPGYSNSTTAGVINVSGMFRISQLSPYNFSWQRKVYPFVGYAYANFSGNATVGFKGTNSTGYTFFSQNYTFLSTNANASSGYLLDSSSLRYLPDSRVTNLTVVLEVNLVSGEFYLDEITLYEISPKLNYINGAIGTTAVSWSARSFSNTTRYWRSSYGNTMIADLIQDGISGIEGFVYEPYLGAVADTSVLFDRYAKGYNLGDSYYMASNNLNWMDVIIGDPKTIIVTPGLSTSVSLNNVLDEEWIDPGTILNFSISSNLNITNLSCSYYNGTYAGNFTLTYTEGQPVYYNTSNWTVGSYNFTINILDFLGNEDGKTYKFNVNITDGRTPTYSTFNGNTTDFKKTNNRTSTYVLLEKLGIGKIDYGSTKLNVSGYNFDSFVSISYNNITVISMNVSSLNTSAELTMYDLRYNSRPLVYRNGILCASNGGAHNCSINDYNSSTGKIIFNVTAFSSYTTGSNANLSVWSDADFGEIKINTQLKFYANYTDNSNGLNISGAACSIIFSDSSVGITEFNSTSRLYEYNRNFSVGGSYEVEYNCSASNYETLVVSDVVPISSCLRPTTAQDWNVTTAQVCENLVFTMPQNKSINIFSSGNLTLINSSITFNITSNGYAGVNSSGVLDILESSIKTLSNHSFFIVNGTFFSLVNSSVSGMGWADVVGARGIEIYSNISGFYNSSLIDNYGTYVYSSNNNLYRIKTSGNTYGLYLQGINNLIQDSILGVDTINAYSSSSSNILLNTTNASSFSGSLERKWYFRVKITDTSNNALDGVTVSTTGYSQMTDSSGYTNQTNLTDNSYTLTVQKSGYYTVLNPIVLNYSSLDGVIQMTAIPGGNGGNGGSGGGGGGGGGGAAGGFGSTYSLGDVVSGSQIPVELKGSVSAVEFMLSVAESSMGAKIEFKDKSVNYVGSGLTYSGFEVRTTNLTLNKVAILFRIKNNWIESNAIDKDKIFLNRFNGTWNRLETNYDSKDENYTYYQAISPGFSDFAVTGERIVVSEVEAKIKEQDTKTTEVIQAARKVSYALIGLVLGLGLLLAIMLGWYFRIRRERLPKIVHYKDSSN